jgi:hypothetical protein
MAAQIIPLDNSPDQSFTVSLSVDGSLLTLQLNVYFSEMANYWLMDIFDNQGNPLLASVPLLTGSYPAANILQQYGYLGIGSAFLLNVSASPLDHPDKNSLGTDFILIWSDTAAS